MGLRTTCLSLTAIFFVVFVFISIISDDIQGIEGKREDEHGKKGQKQDEKSRLKKRESGYMDEFGMDEVNIGGKRFKLYEKKFMNHKKATAYCKKHDGQLAQALNLEEMRRLQILLLRARTVGGDLWVGANKKEWKKHSLKMQRKPNFGPDPMLFGGGPTEMCPALSVSTRSLTPVQCTLDLPFICEFGPAGSGGKSEGKQKEKPEERRGKNNKASPTKKSKQTRSKSKVEMRRRKREVIINSTFADVSATETEVTTGGASVPGDVEDVSEVYVTENPTEAAAEHNIGFSPHVEHLMTAEMVTLVPDTEDSGPKTVKMSTETVKLAQIALNVTRETTTMDPDQMLMDMNDEQTLNLTAIESEAIMNASSMPATNPPSTDVNGSVKSMEFVDSNSIDDDDLSFGPDMPVNTTSSVLEELNLANYSDIADSENSSTDSYSDIDFLPLSSSVNATEVVNSSAVEETTDSRVSRKASDAVHNKLPRAENNNNSTMMPQIEEEATTDLMPTESMPSSNATQVTVSSETPGELSGPDIQIPGPNATSPILDQNASSVATSPPFLLNYTLPKSVSDEQIWTPSSTDPSDA